MTQANEHLLGAGDSVALGHWTTGWKVNVSLTLPKLKSIKSTLPQRGFFILQEKLRHWRKPRPNSLHSELTLGVSEKRSHWRKPEKGHYREAGLLKQPLRGYFSSEKPALSQIWSSFSMSLFTGPTMWVHFVSTLSPSLYFSEMFL